MAPAAGAAGELVTVADGVDHLSAGSRRKTSPHGIWASYYNMRYLDPPLLPPAVTEVETAPEFHLYGTNLIDKLLPRDSAF